MRSLAAAFGLLALVAAAPASAADLPRSSMPYKAPAFVPVGYNWTGFYLGINGGGAWGKSDWNGFPLGLEPSGGMVGVTAGYNWQAPGSSWVFGIEGDIDWAFISDSVACPVGFACETKNNYFGTVRGRVGYAWDRVMPYITGGLAYGDIEVTRTAFAGVHETNAGWTVGAGLEGAIAGNLTAKVEYLYADLGSVFCSTLNCGAATNVDLTKHIVRGGVNYRF
jgi:outer membrane immunogenic protein